MNLFNAKTTAGDLLEEIITAQAVERPVVKAAHLDQVEHLFERLGREIGFRVERIAAPVTEKAA